MLLESACDVALRVLQGAANFTTVWARGIAFQGAHTLMIVALVLAFSKAQSRQRELDKSKFA